MSPRVAEEVVRSGSSAGLAGLVRLRVDLHGVSTFGPGDRRTLIRWEWIEEISCEPHSVVVHSDRHEIVFPSGTFGIGPQALAELLAKAGSILQRADVIAELARNAGGFEWLPGP